MILITLIPIIVPFILLVLLRMPAKKGMTISMILILLAGLFIWKIDFVTVVASSIQGAHKALGILLIVFGAVLVMNTLKKTGAVNRINKGFDSLTKDMRIQAIMIAFLFGAIIEGVAGFGTPAVVVGPLLVALGFKPIQAAVVALISNSVPVPFAAVGVPIRVGLGNVADSDMFYQVGEAITRIDLLAGVFIPTIIMFVLIKMTGSKNKDFFEVLPWTLMIGILYTGIAFVIARTLGYEFVSIMTSVSMLVIVSVLVRFKVLVPKNVWRIAEEKHIESDMSLFKAWSPYVIVIVLLILTRVIPPLTQFTQNFIDLSLQNILGTGLSSTWQLLYSPGTILIFVSVIAFLIQGDIKDFGETARVSFKTIVGAILTLIPTLIMVQIFSNSAMNTAGFDSMPVFLAKELGVILNPVWVFVAPLLGELGSFIAGSATVSALTFSPIQLQIATDYGMNAPLILSLGVMGGAAGNMICVHNVVSVAAVVKSEGEEGSIIRKTVIPALLYAFLLGLSATILF